MICAGAVCLRVGLNPIFIIILATLNDDQRVFVERIFRDYGTRFYNIANKTLKSPSLAGDAVSTAFLKIIENVEKIAALPESQLLAFCTTIVKNIAIDIVRKMSGVTDSDDFGDHNNRQPTVQSPEETYLVDCDTRELTAILSDLPVEEREFIYLRYVDGMNYSAISEFLGISLAASQKRGQRILRKIQELYRKR